MIQSDVSILVIDDVNTMRVQIKELLKTFGFKKISVAENGEEAKLMLEMEPYHLLLCDWHMTPTNGLDLLQYVRSHPQWGKIPFIMVSADSTKERVIEAIKAGVDDYLLKPLTPVQIQNKVYGVLLKKQVL